MPGDSCTPRACSTCSGRSGRCATQGVDVHCTIVGDGWYRSTLEQLQRSLELGNHVRFTGQVSGADMKGWFDRSHVVVAPSVWPEPASLVVPEARRRGKPVVVFDVGGNPEWATLLDGIHVARSTDVGRARAKDPRGEPPSAVRADQRPSATAARISSPSWTSGALPAALASLSPRARRTVRAPPHPTSHPRCPPPGLPDQRREAPVPCPGRAMRLHLADSVHPAPGLAASPAPRSPCTSPWSSPPTSVPISSCAVWRGSSARIGRPTR